MDPGKLNQIRKKKIYFLGYEPFYGSSILRGNHISNALKEMYQINSEMIFSQKSIDIEDLEPLYGHIKDSIVIMLKGNFFYLRSIEPFLDFLKKRGNIIILDLIDYIYFTKWQQLFISIYRYDAVIVQNQYICDEIVERYSYSGICKVIQHHWDPSLEVQEYCETPLKIVFTGLLRDHVDSKELNCNYLDELGIESVGHHGQYYPCHYNVRKKNTWQALTKSNIKLSNASACGSNIIITHDESIKGLVDPDYPYLMKSDTLEEARAMVEKVLETYQGPIWQKGLKMMEKVREQTSINRIIPKYVKLFEELLVK
jgi:hypothetical protein